MSYDRRIINKYFDTENAIDAISLTDLSAKPTVETLYVGTQTLYRANLLLADKTAFQAPAGATWLFGFDNDLSGTPPYLVTTLNAEFNQVADWAEVDPTQGKVCWPVDCTAALLKAYMSSKTSQQTMYACLWMTPAGGKPMLLLQWSPYCMPVAIDPTVATASPGISHLTTEAAAASYVPIWGDMARWRWRNGGWQYLFEADSKWREIGYQLVDGVPVFAPGNPED